MPSIDQPSYRRKLPIICALSALAFFTTAASANPGTAMVMVVGIHLLLGNLVIGIIEWIGLALLGASKARAAIMIPANYISAWAGIYLLGAVLPIDTMFGDDVVANVIWVSWVILIALTLIGIIIELPFIFLAFKKPRKIKRVLISSVLIHIVTGGLVAGWYTLNSNLWLAVFYDSVPAEEIASEYTGPGLWIYFISDHDQSISRMRIDGESQEYVTSMPEESDAAPSYNYGYWLTLYNGIGNDKLDLYASTVTGWHFDDEYYSEEPKADPFDWHTFIYNVKGRVVVQDAASNGSVWTDIEKGRPTSPHSMNTYAADLRKRGNTGPKIELDHSRLMYPVEIIWPDGKTDPLALINAVVGTSATMKIVTILPGDIIVFMLGGYDSTSSHGIYIASLRTHKIAKISNGRSPLVVFEDIDNETIIEP